MPLTRILVPALITLAVTGFRQPPPQQADVIRADQSGNAHDLSSTHLERKRMHWMRRCSQCFHLKQWRANFVRPALVKL